MSFLRALRAYVGLGPDEEVEGRYLEELNARRRELELDEIGPESPHNGTSAPSGGSSNGRHWASEATPGPRPAGLHRAGNGRSRPRRGDAASPPAGGSRPPRRSRPSASTGPGARRRGPRSSGDETRATARSEAPDASDLSVEWGVESPFADIVSPEPDTSAPSLAGDDVTIDLREADEGLAASSAQLEHQDARERGTGAVVRSLDVMRSKPRTVLPESFADAKEVADDFKRGVPLVLNLQSIDRELARRLVDFASGMCYALDGSMEKLASQVFLLIPDEVEVSEHDRQLITERGYAR